MIKRIKGTQDIYFEEMKYWHYVENAIREVTRLYAFQEVRTPIFEATELFKRSVGESTDVVQKEMYTFEDKGGRSITLRPEGTASVARAFVENGFVNLGAPIKLYYVGPMFRYERPQAGRLRQFHQIGVETLGSSHPTADYEVIEFAMNLLKKLKIDDAKLYINTVGCTKCRPKYKEALKDYYADKIDGLCTDCKRRYNSNVMRLLDCKIDEGVAANAPSIHTYLCDECSNHFNELQKLLSANDIDYEIDPKLVRGLDYYTKTAFEIRAESLGSQNQILGGGRYDGLVEYVGGKSVPAVGFAAGIERIIMVLKSMGIKPETEEIASIAVLPMLENAFTLAFEYARRLRRKNISVFVDVMDRNLRNRMKHASRIGAKIALIIGEEEIEKGLVTVKILETGAQFKVDGDFMANFIEEKLIEL
ncbi:histidyl-tRNA synthetase [Kosmotoga arenicorallina S304]|uniref:Histidine--tRNA ligase n=1 Tax=Kosmotoga arenicorallina S304 TaxID=1453497 RepID=A0A176K171_9BACT|nr:histidine--tRNA ligase [Kosmotoga arenicorallina]OAA30420.1 histidyl-tRNA synthetase [Kosmotoga arenicorallina S304]